MYDDTLYFLRRNGEMYKLDEGSNTWVKEENSLLLTGYIFDKVLEITFDNIP